MPYKSQAQRAFMHAKHPDIAAKWDAETGGHIEPSPKREAKPRMRSSSTARALRAGRAKIIR